MVAPIYYWKPPLEPGWAMAWEDLMRRPGLSEPLHTFKTSVKNE